MWNNTVFICTTYKMQEQFILLRKYLIYLSKSLLKDLSIG